MNIIGVIGLVVAFALLIFLAMRGMPILLIALICSTVVALTSGMNIYEVLKGAYMTGYVSFLQANFLVFLAGALFGRMMEITLGADAVASLIVRKLGASKALLAIVLSCGVLAYGGVSVFVVGFTIYPIAVNLFKEANLPRRFLPAVIAQGSITFAMTSPGTPQIQNIIPGNTLGTDTMAGAVVGIICGLFMLIVGQLWLERMVKQDVTKGGHFVFHENDVVKEAVPPDKLPKAILAFIPILVTIVSLNILKIPVEISIGMSVIIGLLLMSRQIDPKSLPSDFARGAGSAVTAITNTCAVVGFGTVVKAVPAFQSLVDWVTTLPILPLLGAGIAVTVICSITGSASGGLGIAIPIVGPIYTAMGVSPAAIHRVASIASGALDSMPHNGYVVTLLNICGCTHKEAYIPVMNLTVILPFVAMLLGIALFQIFPFLP